MCSKEVKKLKTILSINNCNERLGKIFQTRDKYFFYDLGTGKIFECTFEEYKIFEKILSSKDNNELEKMFKSSDIIVDEGNFIRFDMEKALEDNVDEDIIAAGDIFNTLASAEYEYYINDAEAQTRSKGPIPIWGNWCGPEYGSGEPIDLLDYGCREHDWCYGKRGYHKCSCDDDFLRFIINNKRKMTGGQKQAANAVEAWLRIKLNNPGKYGNFSCVW